LSFALLTAAALAASAPLSACTVALVQADGGQPRLSAWPLGLKVERGSADAVAVRHLTLGASYVCGVAGAGVEAGACIVVDPSSCGVAILDAHKPLPAAIRDQLAKVSDESRNICLRQKEPVK
jgi:hypothetical protein